MLGTAACVGMTGKPASSGEISGLISVVPASVNFGAVTVGTTDSQTMRVTNTGTTDLTLTGISALGTGFKQSGLSIPTTLSPGDSTTFTASFKPTTPGNQTGSITISSSASASPMVINLSASGSTTVLQLSGNSTSLNFGTVSVGTTKTQNVQVTNTGNANVTITSVSASGTGFSASGGNNATLAPNQSITVTVNFDPLAPGGVTGNLFVNSNAPTVQVGLNGQGSGQAVGHSVSLDWAASSSVVVGYNVYRGSVSGGPYTKMNSAVDAATSYTDSTVSAGLMYFYVVTAINSSNVESTFSNQVSVTIPSP
jgi:hypothetical protein